MLNSMSFQKALTYSLLFHVALFFAITFKPRPAPDMVINATVVHSDKKQLPQKASQAIDAVSINAREIEETIAKVSQEREKAEKQRQQKLAKEKQAAIQARKKRIAEEKRLQKLKEEARKRAALARKEARELAEIKKKREKLLKKQQAEKEAKARQAKLAEEARARRQQALKAQAEKQAKVNEAVQKYKALILQSISQQWILPANVNEQLSCEFRIRLAPDGSVILAQLSRSSGDSILDRSAESAINKASPLPVPQERELFELFRDIQLTVRPKQARG